MPIKLKLVMLLMF